MPTVPPSPHRKRNRPPWSVRESFITVMCLVVFAALIYLLTKWPDKTDEGRMKDYHPFTAPGMYCLEHDKPYTLQCVPRMVGA